MLCVCHYSHNPIYTRNRKGEAGTWSRQDILISLPTDPNGTPPQGLCTCWSCFWNALPWVILPPSLYSHLLLHVIPSEALSLTNPLKEALVLAHRVPYPASYLSGALALHDNHIFFLFIAIFLTLNSMRTRIIVRLGHLCILSPWDST